MEDTQESIGSVLLAIVGLACFLAGFAFPPLFVVGIVLMVKAAG